MVESCFEESRILVIKLSRGNQCLPNTDIKIQLTHAGTDPGQPSQDCAPTDGRGNPCQPSQDHAPTDPRGNPGQPSQDYAPIDGRGNLGQPS